MTSNKTLNDLINQARSNAYTTLITNLENLQKKYPLVYINVFLKLRPNNKIELDHTNKDCIKMLSPKQIILTRNNSLTFQQDFTFDHIFDNEINSEKIYDESCKHIVDNFLNGFNGGIIFYGQSSSGKSYSMFELLPIINKNIFNNLLNGCDRTNELFKIECSILEIYKENVNDL